MAVKQTAGRNSLGDLAPKFAELNDDVLFGEVWSREDKLSLRDRCIVTVTALMAKGITDNSIKYHIENAKNHGVTKTEMVEIITHAAFYVGWPNAWAVFPMVGEAYAEEKDGCSDSLFGLGEPNVNFAQYFIGNSYLKPLNVKGVGVFNVTFEPKCRNNWHIHHAEKGGGQILVCVAGRGFYQEWGKTPICMTAGDVVNIPAGVKHWHGAAPDSWFSHLVVEVPGENTHTEWCEPVSNEDYANIK